MSEQKQKTINPLLTLQAYAQAWCIATEILYKDTSIYNTIYAMCYACEYI